MHIPNFWNYTTGPATLAADFDPQTAVTCIISFSCLSSNVPIITGSYGSSYTECISSMYLFRTVSCIFVRCNETVTLQGTSNPPCTRGDHCFHYRRVKSVLVSVKPMKATLMKSTKSTVLMDAMISLLCEILTMKRICRQCLISV